MFIHYSEIRPSQIINRKKTRMRATSAKHRTTGTKPK